MNEQYFTRTNLNICVYSLKNNNMQPKHLLYLLLIFASGVLLQKYIRKERLRKNRRLYKRYLKRSLLAETPNKIPNPIFTLRVIDVVYSWIDGNNPMVDKQIDKWRSKLQPMGEAGTRNRFKDMNELKYSLRSVREFAPWVRNIFVVTSFGLIPKWFNVEEGSRHKVFFIDDSTLLVDTPVFNSLAKETVIHKIPGLAENYLYFNDDFFLGSPVLPSDFLTSDGKAKVFLESRLIPQSDTWLLTDDYFQRGLIWTRKLFQRAQKEHHYLFRSKLKHSNLFFKKHSPDIHFVSEDKMKWQIIGDAMHKTSKAKFRNYNQVFDNSLFDYCWKLARGKAVIDGNESEKGISYYYLSLNGNPFSETWGFNDIHRLKPKVFCVNDNLRNSNFLSRLSVNRFKEFLHLYFPRKAPWEK